MIGSPTEQGSPAVKQIVCCRFVIRCTTLYCCVQSCPSTVTGQEMVPTTVSVGGSATVVQPTRGQFVVEIAVNGTLVSGGGQGSPVDDAVVPTRSGSIR
jgi:hypothetical protein